MPEVWVLLTGYARFFSEARIFQRLSIVSPSPFLAPPVDPTISWPKDTDPVPE